jgi:hypothetical protein
MIQEKKFIKEVVKELDSSSVSGSASATVNGKDAFFAQVGMALAAYYKSQEHQQEITFLSMMTSRDKKELLNMKKTVILAKMRADKQNYEEISSSTIPSSVVLVDNNDSNNNSPSSNNTTSDDNCNTTLYIDDNNEDS